MAFSPFGFGPAPAGPYSGLRRSVIDPETGRALVTSEPTGEVVQRSTLLPVGRDDGGRLVPAVPGLAMQAVEAAKYPGQVYRGEASIFDPQTGHVSDEAVGKGFDLAGLAMTGSLPFSKPAGAIGMFGGRNAKTADLGALAKAEGMAGSGADRRTIWDQTGWFQGADQRWRFEIPDDAAVIKGRGSADSIERQRGTALGRRDGEVSVGDVLRHPQAFAAYPELAEVKFSGADLGPLQRGQFEAGDVWGGSLDPRITINSRVPPEQIKSVMLHEGQHPIQDFEGFAAGGDPRTLASVMPDAAAMSDALAMSAFVRRGASPEDAPSQFLNMLGRDPHPAARVLIREHSPDEISAMPATPMDAYKRLAGEVEARNVQTRRDMTPEERRATPPWLTQDVADADQIVRFGSGGPQMSLGDDFFASLESALAQGAKNAEPPPPGPSRVDPGAKSWDLYHGSQAGPDFKRFEPQANSNSAERGAIFFGAEPDVGNFYANSMRSDAEAGPRVFRTTVDPGKTGVFDLRDLVERDPTFNAEARAVIAGQDPKHGGALFDDYMGRFESSAASDRDVAAQLREMGLQPGERTGVSFGYGHIPAAIERARAQGLDTAVLRGLAEHGGADQVVVLTPNRVRSRYSGDLLYGAAPVGLASAAALAAPDAAQAAPSQGPSPVSASPFGFGPQMSPDDLARLFQAQALGAPQGFVPPTAPQVAQQSAPQRRPLSFGGPQVAVAPSGSMRVPLPPARPAEFQQAAQADLPAQGAQPIMAPPAVAGAEGPSMLDRIMGGIRSTDGLLTSLGIGLMSTPGFGQGVAAGLASHQQGEGRRAASRLAQAEYGLKARELARKERGDNQTRAFLLTKGLSAEQADAAMANPTVLSATMAQMNRDPSRVTVGGNIYELKPGERPSAANLLGPAEADRDNTQIVDVPIGNGQTQKQVIKRGETSGPAIGVPVASSQSNVSAQVAERRAAVEAMGADPNEPRNRDYILTGRLPKEDQQVLSAGDKRAINEAEDQLPGIDQTLATLNRARELNRQTYTGTGANLRAQIGTRLPDGLVPDFLADPKGAEATREFGQIMSMEAIKSMSQNLKGATTDREMERFMEILGDPTTPPDVRERTIDRMTVLAQRQKETAEARINDMRGGSYYKPRGQDGGARPGPATSVPQTPARDPLAMARDALAKGAPRDAVLKRLRDASIDPAGL